MKPIMNSIYSIDFRRFILPFLTFYLLISFFCLSLSAQTDPANSQAPPPLRILSEPSEPANNSRVVTAPLTLAPQSSQSGQIQSGSQSPAEDIRDIRGPVHPWWWVKWVVGFLIVLLFLIFASWVIWILLRQQAKVRLLLAHERALKRLGEARMMLNPVKAKEFSILVSDTLRSYVEARFRIKATHQTTEEFLKMLSQSEAPELKKQVKSLSSFLTYSDIAKFAQGALTLPQMEEMLLIATSIVESTAPTASTPTKTSPEPVVSTSIPS